MELDPKWLKPRKERPKRRGLIGALRKETNLKCLILTCLIYGCAVAIVWCRVTRVTKVDIDFNAFPITSTRQISPCDDGYIYIPSAFVVMLYLLYLIECWHCKAWVQLRFEKTDVHRAYRVIEEMKDAQPLVWWKAVCYHYVRRTREIARIHNGDSYPATQVYYERINSNLAAGCFYFGYCGVKDISPELVDLEKHTATKIRLSKGFLFANSGAAQEFEEQRASFFQDQERHDDYMEMKEGLDLASSNLGDFKETMISWNRPDNLPWFARSTVFWICNVFLLSWPLRLILELNTAHVHFQVTKLFGTNYMTPISPLNGLMSSHTSRRARNHHHHRIPNHHHGRRPRHPNLIQPLNNTLPRIHPSSCRRSPAAVAAAGAVISTPQATTREHVPVPPEESTDEMQPLLLSDKPEKDPTKNTENEEEMTTRSSAHFLLPVGTNNHHSHHHHHHQSSGFQSYFNFRHSNRNPFAYFSSRWRRDPRMARSVTLLMTKEELSQFGFNYSQDNFIKGGHHNHQRNEMEETCRGANTRGRDNNNRPRDDINNDGMMMMASGSTNLRGDENSSHSFGGGLAPSYSQALLLLEPNRNHVLRLSAQHANEQQEVITNQEECELNAATAAAAENSSSRNLMSNSLSNNGYYHLGEELMSQRSIRRTTTTTTTVAGSCGGLGEEEPNQIRDLSNNNSSLGDGNTANFSSQEEPSLPHYQSFGMGFGNSELFPPSISSTEDNQHPHRPLSPPPPPPISPNPISSSSLVLNTLAPRGMFPVDLTHPVVLTVPADPHHHHNSPSGDNPPSYEEALRTSRPVFLPTWARIRRCFTERDIHSRLSSSSFWLNYQSEEDDDDDDDNEGRQDNPSNLTTHV